MSVPRARWLGAGVVGVLLLAGISGLILAHRGSGDNGYRVAMRPTAPLSPAACKAEIQALRMTFANFPCTSTQPWFQITVTNVHDANGYPVCRATAYNRVGQALFDRYVPTGVVGGGPSGPAVERGSTLRLIWYLDPPNDDPSYVQHASWTTDEISRYSATCHGRPQSQVPN